MKFSKDKQKPAQVQEALQREAERLAEVPTQAAIATVEPSPPVSPPAPPLPAPAVAPPPPSREDHLAAVQAKHAASVAASPGKWVGVAADRVDYIDPLIRFNGYVMLNGKDQLPEVTPGRAYVAEGMLVVEELGKSWPLSFVQEISKRIKV